MAYTFSYINRHTQFGVLSAELLLVDDAGLMPPQRQWMAFSEAATDEQMAAAANVVIANVLAKLPEAEFDEIINAPDS